TEIASEKYYLEPSSELSRFDIPINYSMFNLKANKLMILISSSNHENEKEIKVTPYNSTYESYYHGATLTIDDLEFGY
ncbi:MAG: hypothetical protein J1E95_07130, partial [Muribaculaceae bacterium]|nr:hypothetical protein [Muribaculaceae bacterium]